MNKIKKKLCPLGKAINHFMIEASISWYRLEMLSGVNKGTLSKLKYGDVSPTYYTMERIAKALNVKHSDIVKQQESINKREKEE